jgi:hypothetical protein
LRRFGHRYRTAWAFALLAGSACAADVDRVMDVTYDPCATQVVANEAATAAEIASLDAARALWNERGGFRLMAPGQPNTASDAVHTPALQVRFQVEFGAFRGFYDDEAGEIIVNRNLTPEARTIVVAHELGHAFGLWHVASSERRSVMNPRNTTIAPLPRDVDDVRALWGSCR